jgi:predicted acyl esterase
MPDLPWHRGWAEDELQSGADETVPLSFDLMPTAYVFAAGHRVTLTITGFDYRESAPTADKVSIQVHSAPDQASMLELPVSRR